MTDRSPPRSVGSQGRTRSLVVAAILILGVTAASWLAGRADRHKREDLLARTHLVAEGLNLERVRVLTGTEGDLDSAVYLRLKDQLGALRAASPRCRFVYLMARRADGAVVFLVDSEPVGSADESPAGQVFGEAPASVSRVFDTGIATVDGPVADRWGTWISAFVPLTDPSTGARLAVVGLDTDARSWRRDVLTRAAWPAGSATALLVAIALGGMALLARRARSEAPPRWVRHLEPVLTAAVGVVLTLFAAWLARDGDHRLRSESFRLLAESRTAAVAEVFRVVRDVKLEALVRFYENSDEVTAEEFDHYASSLTGSRAVQAWGWVPLVRASEKDGFEQAARAAGMNAFPIWERDDRGQRVPATGREAYYPVALVAPGEGYRAVLGFDLGSEPVRRAAIETALRTGLISATDPVVPIQETDGRRTILVLRPVLTGAGEPAPRGFAVVMLDLDDALGATGSDGIVAAELLLAHEGAAPELLATSADPAGWAPAGAGIVRPVFAFGRVLLVAAYPGPGFLSGHRGIAGTGALAAGLLLTSALTLVASVLRRRRETLEDLVRERTASLRESEEHLSATLRSIGDGVIACDREGRVTSLNRVAEELTGWSGAEAAGQRLEDVLHIVDARTREVAESPAARALTAGATVDLAYHTALISRGGAEHQIADSCAPIRDASGTVTGAVLVFRDVTEEYRRRQELREERERLEHILAITGTRIDIVDAEFGLHYVDQGWQRIYGDPTARKCYEYFAGRSEPCAGCVIVEALATRQVTVREQPLPLEGGRIAQIHTIPFRDASGRWLVAEFYVDITERRRAETEREKLQTQLTQAQHMESVGRLAGGVAHDFNNMLGVILGHVELALGREEASPDLRTDLERIRQAAERSADLTRQLLAFARRQTVAPEVLDLNEAVAGTLKLLGRLIGEDVDLVWQPGDGVWPVKIDPAQLDQVLANLCVNARDAIAGVGRITIETRNAVFDGDSGAEHPECVPGDYVLLSVSDDGCGMDETTLASIFDPFFTTKELGKGTGLGLATVYGAVRQNDGFITVRSEPGRGTTFAIHLPRHAGTPEPPRAATVTEKAARGHGTILLVEDEPAILAVATAMLGRLGYDVLAAHGPAEALDLAGEHQGRIDLLLTDVIMPAMNGRDLAERLTALYPGLPTVFMSGYTADVVSDHGALSEGMHFLAKPFMLRELAAKLREVLGDEG